MIVTEIKQQKKDKSRYSVYIDGEFAFGLIMDDILYFKLKDNGIIGRRYFYPLISTFSPYCELESSDPKNLPVATWMADSVVCLPMHHELTEEDVERVLRIVKA